MSRDANQQGSPNAGIVLSAVILVAGVANLTLSMIARS